MSVFGKALVLACALASVLGIGTAATAAVPDPVYVQFTGAAKGALYKPDPALYPSPHVAVIAMHRNSNYLAHISTRELPARGFVVLGMNPRCDNNEALCAPWENNALDVRQGVNYLRALPGITKVVLLGHSGGGPTMSFYQAVSERGVAFCQQANKLIKCAATLAGLPPVDGLILMDAHPGNGINAVRSISAGVLNDQDILGTNSPPLITGRMNPFAAYNGYRPNGATAYADIFKRTYFYQQSVRMNKLIDIALTKLAEVEATGAGDAPFVVPLADGAQLRQIDLSIHRSTLQPRKLVKNDGSVEGRFAVPSVRPQSLSPGDETGFGTTMFLTVKSFLSVRAVRSTDSMDGVDFCSSNNSTTCNLQQVSVPLLVTAMGGHYFIRDSEQFFDLAASADKDFYVIEGATHGGTPCTACQTAPNQYANATKNLFDLMRSWMDARY